MIEYLVDFFSDIFLVSISPCLAVCVAPLLAVWLCGCGASSSDNPQIADPPVFRGVCTQGGTDCQPASPMMMDMVVKFLKIEKEKAAAWDRFPKVDFFGDRCPPEEVFVLNKTLAVSSWGPSVLEGSLSKLYPTVNGKYMIKVVEADEVIWMLWREQAALWVLNDLGIAPRIYDPRYEKISAECYARSYVMDKVGSKTLADLYDENKVTGAKQVARIGIAIINMIEKVHSRGIIHGDIFGTNFVFSDLNDVEGTLKIIDFGRSKPYIDPTTGAHIPEGFAEFDLESWNPVNLSINELNDKTVSRRDDMFRIAELLVFLTDGGAALLQITPRGDIVLPPIRQLVRLKQNRRFSDAVSKQVIDIYYRSLEMGFSETPDYEVFRQILASV